MDEEVNLPIPPAPKTLLTISLLLILSVFSLVVSGYLFWQNQQLMKQLAQIQMPAPIPLALSTPSPEPADPTAGWKTYNNTQFSYSLKYPSNFTINENGMGGGDIQKAGAVGICGKSSDNIQSPCFTITIRQDPDTFENLVNKHYQKLQTNLMTDDDINTAEKNLSYRLSRNQVTDPIAKSSVLSFPAYQFTINGSTVDDGAAEYIIPAEKHKYVWIDGNNFLLISFTQTEIMNQILSTFKFTE